MTSEVLAHSPPLEMTLILGFATNFNWYLPWRYSGCVLPRAKIVRIRHEVKECLESVILCYIELLYGCLLSIPFFILVCLVDCD